MAYNVENLNTISSGKNKNSCTCWTYKSSLEDLATLTADGYFDEDRSKFSMGDSMYLKASDGVSHYYIESLSPHVTLKTVGIELATPQGPVIIAGAGAPTVSKPSGSLYLRTDGSGVHGRLYIAKDDGTWTYVSTGN